VKGIARDDLSANQQVIGITAQHHLSHCLGTKVFLPTATIKAFPAWCGRSGHYRITRTEILHSRPNFRYQPGELMAKRRREPPHRMPAPIGFQISAATQSAFYFQQYFARAWMRRHNISQLQPSRFDQECLT
jgi:hypothetical protein